MNKKTPEKISIVIGLNDFLVGGVQKLALDQCEALFGENIDIHIITLMQFEGVGNFYDDVPDYVHVHKLNFEGLRDIASWLELLALLRKIRPQVVKTALFFSNTVFRLLKLLCGYTVIAAEHNTEGRRPLWQRVLNRILAMWTYTIVADSYTVAEFLTKTEKIPSNKFTVIYNGVDIVGIEKSERELASKRDSFRENLGIGKDDIVLLNVARLAHQKNHELMFEACNTVMNTYKQLHLVIVGDGKLREALENQKKKLPHGDRIHMVGEKRDLYPYYILSDYFILTSRREGFCITAMMGLAFGLPLISTTVAGVIEYTEDGKNGFLADHTKESVEQSIIDALSLTDVKLWSMKEYARNTGRNFSVSVYRKKYKELIDRVCNF